MIDRIDRSIATRKLDLLAYYRQRADESLSAIRSAYAESQFRARAAAVNKAMVGTRDNLVRAILSSAATEGWPHEQVLRAVLMVTYTNYVVMIEARNQVWPYDYMTFSRRIGELWDPFCQVPFDYPLKDLTLFVPPTFKEARAQLTREILDYVDTLPLADEHKTRLKTYYNKVWRLVTSGEIKLELDLHFEQNGERHVVDFKSGFGSNEKGNTNRLLLVAMVYRNLSDKYHCLLLVRAPEQVNNAYFQILKRSTVWEAYCGLEAYAQIKNYSGFDLLTWIRHNIAWQIDFDPDTREYLRENQLEAYLQW